MDNNKLLELAEKVAAMDIKGIVRIGDISNAAGWLCDAKSLAEEVVKRARELKK